MQLKKKGSLVNKMRACKITALVLAVAAIAVLAVGIYGMTRPMSYDTNYYHAVFYEDEDFNGTMVFSADNTMVVRNTNLDEDYQSYYYYKDGYVFFTLAQTEAEYQEEVAAINEDFEGAVNAPFYASKITPFKLTSEGPDGYRSVYMCQSSITMAIGFVAVELALIALAVAFAIRSKKEQ